MTTHQQKVVIITGASQGIGAGLVEAFLLRGYRVVANSRNISKAKAKTILSGSSCPWESMCRSSVTLQNAGASPRPVLIYGNGWRFGSPCCRS